jgi:outer membrane receptor protein involved in Fe transport
VKRPFEDQLSIDTGLQQPVFRERTTTGISDTTINLNDTLDFQLLLSASDFRVNRYSPVGLGISQIDGNEYVAQPCCVTRRSASASPASSPPMCFGTGRTKATICSGAALIATRPTPRPCSARSRSSRPMRCRSSWARVMRKKALPCRRHGAARHELSGNVQEFLPKATVSLDVTPDMTIGVTAGRAYNAGSSSITLAFPFTQYTYKPEYVWTYEGFVRAGLGNDVAFTGNVFYGRFKDMQLPYYLSALSVEIRNAERVNTYGAELGLNWRPSPRNEVFANVGLLDTKIDRYSVDAVSEGNELPRAPALSLNAGFNFSPDGKFELGADVRYTSAYFSDTLNDGVGRISPYAVVNGRVAYSVGPARLFFSVRNLLNSFKPVQVGVIVPGLPDFDYAVLLPPRKISAGVELRF